jgi:uncharacterized protein
LLPKTQATANQFKAGAPDSLDITIHGRAGAMTNGEYSVSRLQQQDRYSQDLSDAERPSHLLLPIIPELADRRPA